MNIWNRTWIVPPSTCSCPVAPQKSPSRAQGPSRVCAYSLASPPPPLLPGVYGLLSHSLQAFSTFLAWSSLTTLLKIPHHVLISRPTSFSTTCLLNFFSVPLNTIWPIIHITCLIFLNYLYLFIRSKFHEVRIYDLWLFSHCHIPSTQKATWLTW